MNSILIYMLLFVVFSPGLFFHAGAPPSHSIRLKAVLIHAMIFAASLVIIRALFKAYPFLEGFETSTGPAPLPEPIARENPPARRS
jgi:hypothetical protein